MAETTAIQWTDSTWNVVTGCTRVSPGCANCYIERTPPFRMRGRVFARVGNQATTGVQLHPERLARVPRGPKIFAPSLSDLFHEDVPDAFIVDVFTVISALAAVHDPRVFQILTKRPERAAETLPRLVPEWPLWNVWLGVSVENARYTWRADVLREIPAAVRFVSAEPLLGSLFDESVFRGRYTAGGKTPLELDGIDWLIVGGESGPGARPMRLDWARELVDACRDANVAVFVKQLGAHPIDVRSHRVDDSRAGSWGATIPLHLRDRKGGSIEEWPADLRIREFPRSLVLG